ncbi:hypothetical protein HMPREF9688_03365 [Klebsiella oxytoca 10-5244]|uniref:DUF551 domain-containing protein n=1 Tax=Klebsiella oxytoca TaxID=571 RepID=UPI000671DC93|nr:hypothetical protein HMPREF9688_03365 [Klebsiella oxytoca 10-5244]
MSDFNGFTGSNDPVYYSRQTENADGTLTNEDTKKAGNSPVIGIDPASGSDRTVEVRYVAPPGYVMVPKEMTDAIGEAIAMHANCCGGIALDIYEAMLEAAPHDTPALNSLQSVDSVVGRWVPVSERMPEDGQHIIIFCDDAFVLFAQHRDGEFFDVVRDGDEFFETTSRCVTHWMPLPAAPQEAQGE